MNLLQSRGITTHGDNKTLYWAQRDSGIWDKGAFISDGEEGCNKSESIFQSERDKVDRSFFNKIVEGEDAWEKIYLL